MAREQINYPIGECLPGTKYVVVKKIGQGDRVRGRVAVESERCPGVSGESSGTVRELGFADVQSVHTAPLRGNGTAEWPRPTALATETRVRVSFGISYLGAGRNNAGVEHGRY
jgi:hypothetical protein